MNGWVLSMAYALHMAATVVWVGGLVFQALFLPAATRSLEPLPRTRMHAFTARRFQPVAWLCLAVLIFTGLTQMAAHPSYTGILEISGRWGQAILSKHLAFGAMVVVAAIQTWGLTPRVTRLLLYQAAGTPASSDEMARALQNLERLTRLNAALALVVLVLTAIARTA